MIRLLLFTFSHALRRLTGTRSVRFPRWRVYAVLGAILTVAVVVLTLRTHAGGVAAAPEEQPLYPSVIALLDVIAAGAALLVADATRDRSGAMEATLSSLPLTRRRIATIVWAPSAAMTVLALLVCGAPSIAAFTGIGWPLEDSVVAVIASLSVGLFFTSVTQAVTQLLLRGSHWDPVRLPVAILLWLGLIACATWATFGSGGTRRDFVSEVLLLPRLLRDVASGPLGLGEAGMLVSLGLVGVVGVWRTASSALFGRTPRRIRQEWRGFTFVGRTWGELRYSLRNASILGNAISALVVTIAIAAVTRAVPPAVHAVVTPTALSGIALFASIPMRSIRGLFDRGRPVQRIIGMSPTSWVLSQSIVGVTVTGLLAAPGIALLDLPAARNQDAASVFAASLLVASSMSLLSSSVLPVAPDNAAGQTIASLAMCAATYVALRGLSAVHDTVSALTGICSVVLLLLVVLATIGIERRRWARRLGLRRPVERS